VTEANQKEFGQIVGLTPRHIRNLEIAGMPYREEGRRKLYPLPAAVHWIRDRAIESAVSDVQPTGFEEARAREMLARAERAEIEVHQLRGRYVDVADLEVEFSQHLAQIRARLLSLPGRIAAELPMPAVESVEIIERVVFEFMSELSEEEVEEPDDAAA